MGKYFGFRAGLCNQRPNMTIKVDRQKSLTYKLYEIATKNTSDITKNTIVLTGY